MRELPKLSPQTPFGTTMEMVLAWAHDRNIFGGSDAAQQTLKAVSEMGELADAVAKYRRNEIEDALGDVLVCLTNVAHFYALDLEECFVSAFNQIKDRQGRMEGGVFVKAGDQPQAPLTA